MQMFPPTVAAFQTLNEARKASQQERSSGAADQSGGGSKRYSSAMRHVAAISRPAGEASSAGQPRPSRSISVSVAGCGSEKSQVPPASQAWPARHSVISAADLGERRAVMVLRFMSECPRDLLQVVAR